MSKSQINLPKTAFSMKANLPVREPEILEYWNKINLYDKLRNSSKGKEKFVLHDGPPYAKVQSIAPDMRKPPNLFKNTRP